MIAARILDVLLVLLLVLALGEGWRNGILRGIAVFLGVAAGGVAAFLAVPAVAAVIPAPEWRLAVSLALALALLAAGYLVGAGIARALRRRRREDAGRPRELGTAERLLGAVAGIVSAALVTTLVAGSVAQLGVPVLSSAVKRSIVVSTIDRITPGPIADGLAQVRAAIFERGIPSIDEALGGIAGGQRPPELDTEADALMRAAASVARISGPAYACGRNQSGSGFVIAPERVLTNAHVVAGVGNPVVELPDGQVLDGRIVLFDPEADLAIIAVPGLEAAPLALADAAVGDEGVVDGYPHGGGFVSSPARVLAISTERVADIYGESSSPRDVLTLAAEVRPGNSGGPFVTLDGRVGGLVFARNADHANLGYATPAVALEPLAQAAAGLEDPVPSGSCITD